VSTITIASFTIRVGDSDFYDKLNSSLQSTKRDCFTLHENPSLIDLLPGFITQRLKRKENSLKTIYLFFWITCCFSFVVAISQSYRCSGILTWFPFACFLQSRCLTYHLGSTHPYSITVFMEPFSTSVFKFYFVTNKIDDALTWIFATTTRICTNHNFIEHHCSISTLWSHLSTVENLLCLSQRKREGNLVLNSQSKSTLSASSIFRPNSFVSWVITPSFADFDFHDHRTTVSMN
jgi:hypothetical protein